MPAGFPVKQNYAAGDILTATQMNDLSATLNYLDPTAKGDLFPASSGTALSRLAVGANGETIVADSSTSTGLRYQSGYNGNSVINGGQDIWQRGTSIANTATYVYAQDRYRMGPATAQTTSRQAVNDATNLPTIQYCARMQRNSGSTSTTDIVLGYSAESADSYRFAGQTVTFSFYARAGANYSAASSAFRAVVNSGTGTDQNILAGYTGAATVINGTATLTTSWQRFSFTGTVPATATEIGHSFFYTPVGTAGANDHAEITGVQLEIGSVATTFKRASGGSIQGELAMCQRYYFRSRADQPFSFLGNTGYGNTTTLVYIPFVLPVRMRTYPTALDFGGQLSISDSQSRVKGGTWSILSAGTVDSPVISYLHGSAIFTQFRSYGLQADNDANTFVGFSAEL